ncbi:hypothetical protein LVJ94_52275 [Pendulispora rubella]|uniref:PEGA domain-containing protein n=1 Tax=Pendulispora rubella TaxID=2741070 RepID=A0ABZ2L408_9BACT
MRAGVGRWSVCVGAILASFPAAPVARAAEPGDAAKARCAASYEAAQMLRREERLSAARAELLVCEETCPEKLAEDCAKWRGELAHLMPTARFFVRDAEGRPLGGVRVAVDGHAIDGAADEASVLVEPGRHVFRFERQGYFPAEVRSEFHVGERDHVVHVVLASIAPVQASAARTSFGAAPRPAPRASRTPSYVLGGIGLAALATAGGLALKGYADRASLRDSCAPTCEQSDIDSIRTLWWVAAGVAVAGATSIGVAIVLWPREPSVALTVPFR